MQSIEAGRRRDARAKLLTMAPACTSSPFVMPSLFSAWKHNNPALSMQ